VLAIAAVRSMLRAFPLVSPHPYLYLDEVVEILRMPAGLKRAPSSSPTCKPVKVNLLLSCNVRVMPMMAGYASAWMSMLAGDDLNLLRTCCEPEDG
jgi:hypothetical protein